VTALATMPLFLLNGMGLNGMGYGRVSSGGLGRRAPPSARRRATRPRRRTLVACPQTGCGDHKGACFLPPRPRAALRGRPHLERRATLGTRGAVHTGDDEIRHIAGTDLWLVPVTVHVPHHRLQLVLFPGLAPIACDVDQDEYALVKAYPGKPFYCYRCRVSSDDANPHLAALVRRGDGDLLGVPPYGCLDTDAVAQLMLRRAQQALSGD
jgi:hypothetical protein